MGVARDPPAEAAGTNRPYMSSGQTSQAIVTQAPAPQQRDAGVPSDLRTFLVEHLHEQVGIAQATAGAIYLAGSTGRRAGVAVTSPPEPSEQGPLTPTLLARLERLGREQTEAWRLQGGAEPDNQGSPFPRGQVIRLNLPAEGDLYGLDVTHLILVSPLTAAGATEGANLLVLPDRSERSPQDTLERLALANARFEAFLWQQHALGESGQKAMLRQTLELLDASQQSPNARVMASLLCHELQRRFGCTRASIGLIRGDRLRLVAAGSADELHKKGAAAEALEQAMEECAAQDVEVLYPQPEDIENDPAQRRVVRAHARLSEKFGPSSIVSLPLRVEGDLAGVVVLEREPHDPFPRGSLPLLRLTAEFIGPALWTRRLADRGVIAVTRDRTLEIGQTLVGPRRTGWKLLGLLVLLIFLGLAFIPIPSRVAADAELKASLARTIVPPFTGYLSEVSVRPGDRVEAGQVIALMDTHELELELLELASNLESLRAQRDQAAHENEASDVRTLSARIDEVQSRIRLLEDRIDRANVRAPIAGIVSRGDLEEYIGARVEPTQPLIEVVGDNRRVIAKVDERDIGRVRNGQEGRLASKALPGEKLPVRVERINPASDAVEGANVYHVELSLTDLEAAAEAGWLHPGMTGTVKLDDGRTTGLRALLDPVIDEVRLRLWW